MIDDGILFLGFKCRSWNTSLAQKENRFDIFFRINLFRMWIQSAVPQSRL
jgi:hypothetical protein